MYGGYVVLLGGLRLGRFLRPVLNVLDRLRQRTVQRLREEKSEQTASDCKTTEQYTGQPRHNARLFHTSNVTIYQR